MAGNIKGITIEFRGDTTQLDKALRSIDKETSTIDSELKKVNNGLKFNPTSVELWRQKQTLLTQKVNETSERLKTLKEAQKKMAQDKSIDQNSAEYRNLQREIITTESKLKTFKGQLKSIGSARLAALGAQFKQIGSKMTTVGRTMTTYVTGPIVAGFTVASKSASDYEENLNKIDVAFGKSADAVKKWAKTARKNFGMSQVQATGAASGFGALAKGIGLSEKASAKVSTKLAGLSADLGSYFNTGTDESAKALEGIFTGESEALKRFGVVMTDANLQKFAEDQGKVWKEMSQTEKTMLRYDYVLSKTKDAQGDFKRTNTGTANSIKIFKSTIEDLSTNIGTVLLPIITPIIQKVGELVGRLADLPQPVQKIIVVVGLLAAALGPILLVAGSLATAIGTLLPMLGGISLPIVAAVAAIGALVAAFVAAYAKSASFRKVINSIATTVGSLLKSAFMSAAASVKSLIADLSKTVSVVANELGPVLKMLMPVLKLIAALLIGRLKNAFNMVIGVIRVFLAIIRTVATIARTVFQTVVTVVGGAVNKIKSAFSKVKDALTGPFEKAKSAISGVISAIKGMFPISIGNILSNVKLPHFSLQWGSKDFGPLGKISYPKGFDVSWYARGGIFNSPTLAGIGEAGPEAVVPLDKFWRKLEEMQTGNVNINVYASDGMNEQELAEIVMQKIIQLQNRRRVAWQ